MSIAEENREKIDDFVVPETTPRKAYTLADLGEDTVLAKISGNQRDFAKPGRGRGNGLGRGLDDHRSIGNTGHICLLEGMCVVLSSQRGTFYASSLLFGISLRNSWVFAGVGVLR